MPSPSAHWARSVGSSPTLGRRRGATASSLAGEAGLVNMLGLCCPRPASCLFDDRVRLFSRRAGVIDRLIFMCGEMNVEQVSTESQRLGIADVVTRVPVGVLRV